MGNAEPGSGPGSGDGSARLHPRVRTGLSPIAGQGLFAGAALPAGTAVVLAGRPERVAETVPANHSCEPNLGWARAAPDPFGGAVVVADDVAGAAAAGSSGGVEALVALRDIAAGEELTHDYATSVSEPAFLLHCNCGSMRCRGLVEGDDWRIPQLQGRYAGHFTAAVQRLVDDRT